MERIYLSLCPTASLLGMGVIVYALLNRGIMPERALYLILLLALFSVCFTLLLRNLLRGENLAYESNWGGLGGGLSGWTLSPSLLFLLFSIGLLALLSVAVLIASPPADLSERYRAALNLAAQRGIQFNDTRREGGKLVLTGTAPSTADINAFWDQVKLANPIYDDIQVRLTVKTTQPASTGPASGSPGGTPSHETPPVNTKSGSEK